MAQDEIKELLKKIGEDVDAIKRYNRFQARDAMLAVLNKITTTPERQQMWRFADGTHSNEQIASEVGVTVRTVQYFVGDAESLGLLTMEKRGYPKRIEDMFPSEWKPWKPKKEQEEATPQPQEITGIPEEKPDAES